MKKILIIGGSGFVGKSFKEYIKKKKKFQLKSYSRSEKRNILKINKLPKANFIIYCIKNDNIKKSLNFFFHFKKLLQLNHKETKILFFSSGSVYGPRNKSLKFSEKEKPSLKKINKFKGYKKKYAKEKFILEKEFKKLGNNGHKVCIIRGFTFYGRYILKENYLISQIVKSVKSKKNLLIKNIKVQRSFMHADEMCEWIMKIIKTSSTTCPIYNVGSDKIENIEKLINFLNRKYQSKIFFNKNKSKIKDFYVPNTNLVKNKLKLRSTINFKDAVSSLIN